MKKSWMVAILAASLSMNLPLQAAVKPIEVVYDGTQMQLEQAPVIRKGKVWLPIRAILDNMNYKVSYDKEQKAIYISGGNIADVVSDVVEAGSARDDGSFPILLDHTVYLSIRDVGEFLKKDVKWEAAEKRVNISSIVTVGGTTEEMPVGELRYNTENGDFYNGKMLIANLPFTHLECYGADKQKTAHGHVLYTLGNSYGEPHINDELYAVYAVNGGIHTAKSFKWNINGENSLIQEDKVVLIDKNVISVYDDVTGNLIKRHTISTKPLIDYVKKNYEADYVDEIIKMASMGYLVEAVNDDFVLYRNYELKTLTFVSLKDGHEVELYQKVYSPDEIASFEHGRREDGDYLQFVKAEKGVIYLKHAYEDKTYQYKYQ